MKKYATFFSLAMFLALFSFAIEANDEKSGVENALKGSNYLAARRVLLAAVEKKRPKDESLAREWSKSLIALVSLERLMGDEAEARKLFFRCDASCARHIGSLEWNNIRSWACEPISEQKKEICRSKKRKP